MSKGESPGVGEGEAERLQRVALRDSRTPLGYAEWPDEERPRQAPGLGPLADSVIEKYGFDTNSFLQEFGRLAVEQSSGGQVLMNGA